jgi:hypothetical protein
MSSQTVCAGIASILILIVFFYLLARLTLKKKPYLFISIKTRRKILGLFRVRVYVDFAF